MYRLLPLLGDVGLGILSIVFVSLYFGKLEAGMFLLLPIIFLPDLDAVSELWRRGKVAASSENPHDHREVLHKPMFWILGALVWWYLDVVYGAIALALVVMHFLHDSVLTGWGVSWLAPFSDARIKFFVDERNRESLAVKDWVRVWNKRELVSLITTYGNDNWIEDLYLRPTTVSIIEYGIFLLSLFTLGMVLFA